MTSAAHRSVASPSGATGEPESDTRILAAEHFTFSNMLLPPGAIGPEHNHHDAEVVFFVRAGTMEVTVHDVDDGTRTASRVPGDRDPVKVPTDVPRSLRNVGDTDALFCVMIGSPEPQLPTSPRRDSSPAHGATDRLRPFGRREHGIDHPAGASRRPTRSNALRWRDTSPHGPVPGRDQRRTP